MLKKMTDLTTLRKSYSAILEQITDATSKRIKVN